MTLKGNPVWFKPLQAIRYFRKSRLKGNPFPFFYRKAYDRLVFGRYVLIHRKNHIDLIAIKDYV